MVPFLLVNFHLNGRSQVPFCPPYPKITQKGHNKKGQNVTKGDKKGHKITKISKKSRQKGTKKEKRGHKNTKNAKKISIF